MNASSRKALPKWAPRVAKRDISRLYELNAKGIYDEDLINEVGYGLLARCQSFIDAVDAVGGRARCPQCSETVQHKGTKEEWLQCDCGWKLRWGDYFKTIQHKQLSGAEPVLRQFRAFMSAFPAARTLKEKVYHIDRLIHGFHRHYKDNSPTRPVGVNLIQGKLRDVVAFLDELSHSEQSTQGMGENKGEWDRHIQVYRSWYKPARKQEPEPGPEGAT